MRCLDTDGGVVKATDSERYDWLIDWLIDMYIPWFKQKKCVKEEVEWWGGDRGGVSMYSKYSLNTCNLDYVNVFRKSDLWQNINDAILLFFSAKIVTFSAINV